MQLLTACRGMIITAFPERYRRKDETVCHDNL
jgi:hypothetical protein